LSSFCFSHKIKALRKAELQNLELKSNIKLKIGKMILSLLWIIGEFSRSLFSNNSHFKAVIEEVKKMETYTILGALMLPNELPLLEAITGLGFFSGMFLILAQVFWLDQSLHSGKESTQTELDQSRRGFQRITLPEAW
jgi:hypothetical protein